VRKGGRATIAADTLYTAGSLRTPGTYAKGRSKLVPVDDGWIGLVGSPAHQLTLSAILAEDSVSADFSTVNGIFQTLVSIQQRLVDGYFTREKEDDDDQPYSSNHLNGLICNPHGIFEMESYREVCEYEHFWAIGSGDRLAIGAMHAVFGLHDEPEAIARVGLEAACTFDARCGAPYEIRTVDLL
jgi:ATP-dependent HslUV protease subunit HslV